MKPSSDTHDEAVALARELVEWAERGPHGIPEADDIPEMRLIRDNTLKVCRALLAAQRPSFVAHNTDAAPQEPKVGPASTDSPADIATPAGAAPSAPSHVAATDADVLAKLQDPEAVCVNMIRGTIAKPSIRALLHVHGEEALAKWDAAQSSATAAPVWIPVGERLPTGDEQVLAAGRDNSGYWRDVLNVDWVRLHGAKDGVTHWMPLPAGPVDGGAKNG